MQTRVLVASTVRYGGEGGGGGYEEWSLKQRAVQHLDELVYRRLVSEEVLAGTEVPGGGAFWIQYLTIALHSGHNT